MPLWKRKAKNREEKSYKTEIKVENRVFDRSVLLSLDNLIKRRVIDSLDYCVSTGKEADVYRGTSHQGFVAVKIFRILTSGFNKFQEYFDEEMKIMTKKHSNLRELWAAKEFNNLEKIANLGIAPRPIHRIRNINVMEFLGEEGLPYPLLKNCKEYLDQNHYDAVIDAIKKMFENDLVHADLSEFNILFTGERIYVIDLAQGVSTSHPESMKFLTRDIENINKFFSEIEGIKTTDKEDIIKDLLKDKKNK